MYLLTQQTVVSEHNPEEFPPLEVQSALDAQTPSKPQSPTHDCFCEFCRFLFVKELNGIIGGKKKTENN